MSVPALSLVYFFYGLSFFTMGFLVIVEHGRGSDDRLRHALRPLAAFGMIHGFHEWMEMFYVQGNLPFQQQISLLWDAIRIGMLAFSFLSLGAFGASLLSPTIRIRRYSMLLPLISAAIWGFGIFVMRGHYVAGQRIWVVADVWTRYVLAIPAALVACFGLVAQQRAFRKAGMAQFGRDCLWAAVAFAWYGLVGQLFTKASVLPPSTFLNQDLFYVLFGFPVQVMRAISAGIASAFVIRFLRAFEVDQQRQIADLQAGRLRDSERREQLRGQLLQRVVTAQEAERQRVARELHDETGQALTALGMGLRGVTNKLKINPDQAAHMLRQLEDLSTQSLIELQRLISDLRPAHLDDLGLEATLHWYLGEIQKRVPLKVNFYVEGEIREPEIPIRVAIYRIIQEAVNNIIKHANAQEAWVRIHYMPDLIGIYVEDNGKGFIPTQLSAENRSSWGLLGMEERVNLLGGKFQLESEPGKGTRVMALIPNPQAVPQEPDHTKGGLDVNSPSSGR